MLQTGHGSANGELDRQVGKIPDTRPFSTQYSIPRPASKSPGKSAHLIYTPNTGFGPRNASPKRKIQNA